MQKHERRPSGSKIRRLQQRRRKKVHFFLNLQLQQNIIFGIIKLALTASNISLKGKLNRFAEPKIKKVSIEKVIDWLMIANKFREISGDEEYLDTSSLESKGEEGQDGNNAAAYAAPHAV